MDASIPPDLKLFVGPLHDVLTRLAQAIESNNALLRAIEGKLVEGPPEYLSIKQAAAVAGLSPTKIRREVKAGRLSASDIGSPGHPHYRLARADLQTWMERNKGGAEAPPKPPIHRRKVRSRYFGEI